MTSQATASSCSVHLTAEETSAIAEEEKNPKQTNNPIMNHIVNGNLKHVNAEKKDKMLLCPSELQLFSA